MDNIKKFFKSISVKIPGRDRGVHLPEGSFESRHELSLEKNHTEVPLSRVSCYVPQQQGLDSYDPVLIGRNTLENLILDHRLLGEVLEVLSQLDADDYVRYTMDYYRTGRKRFGEKWCYADITTALLGLSKLLQPNNYLEIGVRRGRSMAMVAHTSPNCSIVGFDLWSKKYAGMPNPGANFVKEELRKLGFTGELELISGNSHDTVKDYLNKHSSTYFDLITVDGDHSFGGAAEDLSDVLPRLKVGGALVFDDIVHPKHRYLYDVWRSFTGDQNRFTTWEFEELGYGVAIAIRLKE